MPLGNQFLSKSSAESIWPSLFYIAGLAAMGLIVAFRPLPPKVEAPAQATMSELIRQENRLAYRTNEYREQRRIQAAKKD